MPEHFSIKLELFFESKKIAETILKAIKPEIEFEQSIKRLRSKTRIKIDGAKLLILIKASDATALRASFNSCLKPAILSHSLLQMPMANLLKNSIL